MDGQTLQQLFAGSNPFLAQMGEQAFNQTQEKEKANLASIMGQEQRAQAMHPLEMQARQTNNRLNASTAGLNEYSLNSKPDAETARKSAMQKMLGEMDDTTRSQFKSQVTRNMQIAAMAKANGGALPPGIQLSPDEIKMFSPANLDKIIKHGETFLQYDPEEIGKRQRAAEQRQLEELRAQGRIDLKSLAAPGKGSGGPTGVPQSYAEILAGMAKLKKASERLAYLKSVLPAVPDELAQALRPAYDGLRAQAEAELNSRTAGQVDIAATTNGKVPVTPPVSLGDAPNAVTNRPARQEAAQPPKYTQADLEFTAKKYNITVEQVKKQLGIK